MNHDGKFNYLTSVAIRDKYQFKVNSTEDITFHYNDDAECREARALPLDKASFVLYVSQDAPPFVLEEGVASPEQFDKDRVLHWINLSITETHMKWSARALQALVTMKGYVLWAEGPLDSEKSATVAGLKSVNKFTRE